MLDDARNDAAVRVLPAAAYFASQATERATASDWRDSFMEKYPVRGPLVKTKTAAPSQKDEK